MRMPFMRRPISWMAEEQHFAPVPPVLATTVRRENRSGQQAYYMDISVWSVGARDNG